MLDSFANYFWTHPVAIAVGAIAVIIILIWMTGSGSRQRFISFKRTKETDQLARDLSRIAAALERIARSQETPTDYVGRPIPPGWEESISSGEPSEEVPPQAPVIPNPDHVHAGPFDPHHAGNPQEEVVVPQGAPPANSPASNAAHAASSSAPAARRPAAPSDESAPASFANPLGRTADLLGKKKLDIPNPLYRPK